MNETRTDSSICAKTEPRRYALIDKDGNTLDRKFETAFAAALFAIRFWPDQGQDPDRTGAGWDVEVAR